MEMKPFHQKKLPAELRFVDRDRRLSHGRSADELFRYSNNAHALDACCTKCAQKALCTDLTLGYFLDVIYPFF